MPSFEKRNPSFGILARLSTYLCKEVTESWLCFSNLCITTPIPFTPRQRLETGPHPSAKSILKYKCLVMTSPTTPGALSQQGQVQTIPRSSILHASCTQTQPREYVLKMGRLRRATTSHFSGPPSIKCLLSPIYSEFCFRISLPKTSSWMFSTRSLHW